MAFQSERQIVKAHPTRGHRTNNCGIKIIYYLEHLFRELLTERTIKKLELMKNYGRRCRCVVDYTVRLILNRDDFQFENLFQKIF